MNKYSCVFFRQEEMFLPHKNPENTISEFKQLGAIEMIKGCH